MPDYFQTSCQLHSWGERYPDGIACLGRAGIEGFEIGSKFLLRYERGVERWRALVKDGRMKVSAVYEFGHFDNWPRRREIYLHHDRLGRLMEQAGIPLVVLGPGIQFYRNRTPQNVLRMIQMVDETARRYEAHGVKAGIHPHWGHCIFTEDDIDLVMERVQAPIGLVPDLGHLAAAGVDLFRLLRKYVARTPCIHLKDGCDTDFVRLFRYLRQSRYGGWLTLETEGAPSASPEQAFHSMLTHLRQLKVL